MSNQIVITSGAKVRNLDGVLTGTSGIVGSVGFGTANGVATLDSSGKVPLSQLPASVITYLGTWNASTNTPTLTNGVGDVGDLYICNVAGTVNFGAGPITFAVGDWVIYSGTTWEKSGGASGTVTSVAMTVPTGLSVTGSPITTSGTLAVSLSSGYTIPTTSFLSGLVPYTGATQSVDLGAYDLNARGIKINGTGGLGHADFKHQSGIPTGSASSSTLYANTDGDLAWLNDHSHTITLAASANTADRTYTFPNASGTIALTSDISYPVTSVFGRTGAVTAQSGDYTTTQVTEGTNLYFTDARARAAISLTTNNATGAATYNSTTGVLNIPNYSAAGYVPYIGATASLDLGTNAVTAFGVNIYGSPANDIGGAINIRKYSSTWSLGSGDNISLYATTGNALVMQTGSRIAYLDFNSVSTSTPRTYTFPNATGTLALTSDIPSLANYVTTNTNQTITGIKTFSNEQLFGNGLTINGGFLTFADSGFSSTLDTTTLTASRAILLPNASGTLALTSDLSSYVTLASNQTVTGLKTFTNDQTFNGNIIGTTGYFTTNLVVGTLAGSSYKLDVTGNSRFTSDIRLDNGAADGAQLVLASSGFSDWNIDNFSGNFRWYYGATERMRLTAAGILGLGITPSSWGANWRALQMGSYGAFVSGRTDDNSMFIGKNVYFDGTNWIGTTTGYAQQMFFNSTGDTIFRNNSVTSGTATGFNTTMTILASGNVGIGTSSPNSYADRTLQLNNSSTNSVYLKFTNSTTGSASGNGFDIGMFGVDTYFYNREAGAAIFATSNTEKMRITSSGDVGIGVVPATFNTIGPVLQMGRAIFYGYSNEAALGANFRYESGDKYINSDYGCLYQMKNGTHVFSTAPSGTAGSAMTLTARMIIANDGWVTFQGNGNGWTIGQASGVNRIDNTGSTFRCLGTSNGYTAIAASAFNVNSDYRLKEDLKDFDNSLDIIKSIKIYDFKWKDKEERNYGVIAHELQAVLPYIVYGEKDGLEKNGEIKTQGVDYGKLVPVLVKAIQEQQAQIEELKALINK